MRSIILQPSFGKTILFFRAVGRIFSLTRKTFWNCILLAVWGKRMGLNHSLPINSLIYTHANPDLDLSTILQRYDCIDELTEKENLFFNLQSGILFILLYLSPFFYLLKEVIDFFFREVFFVFNFYLKVTEE